MKINSTTLKTRDTSVTAGIDKHITASITIAAKVNVNGGVRAAVVRTRVAEVPLLDGGAIRVAPAGLVVIRGHDVLSRRVAGLCLGSLPVKAGAVDAACDCRAGRKENAGTWATPCRALINGSQVAFGR